MKIRFDYPKWILWVSAMTAFMGCASNDGGEGVATSDRSAIGTASDVASRSLRNNTTQTLQWIGAAVAPQNFSNPKYTKVLAQNFNYVTAENAMKWGVIHPGAGDDASAYNFGGADQLVDFAAANGMQVKGHTLVWGEQKPDWMNGPVSTERLRAAMNSHIATVVGRYKGRVLAWDVVNEAVDDSGELNTTVFRNKLGDGYIEEAFRAARAADPSALLFYNDYNIENHTAKFEGMMRVVEGLASKGLIDGVGFQMHLDGANPPAPRVVAERFRRITSLGLRVNISELDVAVNGIDGERENAQRKVYEDIIGVCAAEPGCMSVTFWGVSDADTWLTGDRPLLFDGDYRAKAGFYGVLSGLGKACAADDGCVNLADPRVFDPQFYLDLYGDLQAALGPTNIEGARSHWINYGAAEGRIGSPNFNSSAYLSLNPDVGNAFGASNYVMAVTHFLKWGNYEGRDLGGAFNAPYYLSKYDDLRKAFGSTNFDAALEHWLTHGIDEGRVASASFDAPFYLSRNPSVAGKYGATNFRAALGHWVRGGRDQGLVASRQSL